MLYRVAAPPGTPATGFPIETTVRDALYDRIPLSRPEIALISTPEIGRLERIQQLGFVSRVWPGARHTRFEHSLGVMHLTRLAVDHLRSTSEGGLIGDGEARVAVAAALLHDVGHYPFSHAIEELGPPIVPHERASRNIIENTLIATILEEQWGVDPRRVAAMVDPSGSHEHASDRLLRGVLSGALDMDKLDYLPRDARACNVPYGGVDADRLIDALSIGSIDGTDQSEATVMIGEKGISPLHSLINARQEMFDNVYWHHTNRACMAMLLRATQDALLASTLRPEELHEHDDASLLSRLESASMPETTRRLARGLRDRHIHKRAVEIGSRAFELYARLGNLFFDPEARRAVEVELSVRLAKEIGTDVPPEAVLIDIPKPEKWRTDVWVSFDSPPIGFRRIMPWREVVGLTDEDFKRYEEHRRLIRVVAAEPYQDAVAASWERLLLPLLGAAI
jgi:HD superfamily phosphohydrolase